MSDYLNYFIGGSDQIVVLVTALVLWFALATTGGVLAGRERLTEGDPLYGWAAVCLVFTVFGVVFATPFTVLAWIFFAAAVIAGAYLLRRERRLWPPGAAKVAILALPLLVITAATAASQWDEFSHWLPAPRFLLQSDGFPAVDNPVTGTQMLYAYPYGWPLLSYLAGRLAGHFVENVGAVINILLLLSFGLAATRVALMGAGRKIEAGRDWGLAALAFLLGTLFNPSFVQKIVLTAYAEVCSATAVAFGALLGWLMLGALADGDDAKARRLAWQFGLVMVVLVNAKQVNLVLFTLVVIGVATAAARDPAVNLAAFARWLPLMVGPALVVYGLWRFHAATALADPELFPAAEAVFRPFDEWNLGVIPGILAQMLTVAGKKFVPFAVMAVAVGFAMRGLIRSRDPFDRLALISACVFLGYNGFLLFTYVASFAEKDALRVVSYWRYNLHLGPLVVLFAVYGAGMAWRRHFETRAWTSRLAVLAVIIVLAAPFVFAHKLRIDLEAPKPHFRAVAERLAEILAPNAPLVIVDPAGTGESAVIARYTLDRHTVPYLSAFHGPTAAHINEMIERNGPDARVLVHSLTPAVRQALGVDFDAGASFLLAQEDGAWRVLHTWPYPTAAQAPGD